MNAPDLRIPPHSIESEQSLLGGICGRGLVEHQRRALETHDLAKRLEAIEQQLSKGKP